MANISKQQLREILTKAPNGTTPQGIIDGLQKRGHTIEGLESTVTPTPQPSQAPKPNFFSQELTGGAPVTETGVKGFAQNVFQSTVGSRGILGVMQLPGQVAAQPGALKAQTQTAQSAEGLANATTQLIQRRRTETDPARVQAITNSIQGNLQTLKEMGVATDQLDRFIKTPGEAVGTTINAATTVGAGLVPGVSGIASKGALGVAERVGARAGINFTQGAVVGTGEALSQGDDVVDALKQGLKVGGISSVLGVGTQATREVFNMAAGPDLIRRVYDRAIGTPKKIASSGKSPSETLIKEGVVGTARQIYDHEEKIATETGEQIQGILSKSSKSVESSSVYDDVAARINEYQGNVGQQGVTANEIKEALSSAMPNTRTLISKETLTIAEANQLRSIIDKTRNSSSFYNSQLPQNQDMLKRVSDGLRVTVQTIEPKTKPLFSRQSTALTALGILNDQLNKPRILTHLISMMTGIGGAFATGPSGLLGVLAVEGSQSTIGQSAAAASLNALRKADNNIKTEIVRNLTRYGVQKVLSQQSPSQSGKP